MIKLALFGARNAFRTMPFVGVTKGICDSPGELVCPLDPAAAYLGTNLLFS